ncbi:hypothetical protein [Breoghania sp.]|uniref:hypothetical protein n=1 Tax=Breoghania sp. TaxID=2065378 RepID=UPI0029CA633F|nr:hypothetical protein [Breoghania sp.]
MEGIAGDPTSPIWSQLAVTLAVIAVFFAGLFVRQVLAGDQKLNWKQALATGCAVFFMGSVPLCEIIHKSILGASSLFPILSAFVPVFGAGFASNEEIKKHLKGSAEAA